VNHCLRHYEEPITARCRACQHPFCARCLVYAFGPKKPPFCVGCALHASGIRNGHRVVDVTLIEDAPPPAAVEDKRVARAYRRAERDAQKASAKAAKRASRKGEASSLDQTLGAGAARSSQVPAPSELLARAPGGTRA